MTKNEIEMIVSSSIEKYFEAKEGFEEKKQRELELRKEKKQKEQKEKEKRIFITKIVIFFIIGSAIVYASYRTYNSIYQMLSLL